MDPMIVQLLVFVAVVAVVLSVVGFFPRLLGGGEGRSDDDRESLPTIYSWFPGAMRAVGETLEAFYSGDGEANEKINHWLKVAAFNDRLSGWDVRGLQVILGLGGGTIGNLVVPIFGGAMIWSILAGLLLFLCGLVYPMTILRRAAEGRQDEIRKELPFSVDLLTVSMEAGQEFMASVRELRKELPNGALRQEITLMLRQVDTANVSRPDALRSMSERVDIDELKSIVSSIVQSAELGASAVVPLKLQAQEIRRGRTHQAERKAARVSTLMLFPMALLILPSVFIVVAVPVAIRLMNSF